MAWKNEQSDVAAHARRATPTRSMYFSYTSPLTSTDADAGADKFARTGSTSQ